MQTIQIAIAYPRARLAEQVSLSYRSDYCRFQQELGHRLVRWLEPAVLPVYPQSLSSKFYLPPGRQLVQVFQAWSARHRLLPPLARPSGP